VTDSAFEEQQKLLYLMETRIFATQEEKADRDWKPWKWEASTSEEEYDGKGMDNMLRLQTYM
jgi:hypothetical protein